jgi:hypothetical protein
VEVRQELSLSSQIPAIAKNSKKVNSKTNQVRAGCKDSPIGHAFMQKPQLSPRPAAPPLLGPPEEALPGFLDSTICLKKSSV